MKAWKVIPSNLKNERDVDTLNRPESPGAALRALIEIYTPRIEEVSMVVLDKIINFRMTCEEHSVKRVVEDGKSSTGDSVQ